MPLGVRGAGEAEDGGGGYGDGDAVGDDGVGDVVAGVLVLAVLARDGVGHAYMMSAEVYVGEYGGATVTEMNASVAEADASKRGGEEHFALRLMVIWVPNRAGQVLNRRPKRLEGEDITNGICALVRGAINRVLRAGNALVIRDGSPALEAVTEDIQA